ncbi:thiamine-phosphate kinase [Pararhodospirillum photometricum]|uniref:Thiamine-monophosphate kinase n=1 Tax=Pararhodospirillum photometricum DSM 122 TaxID=1150469 RepID=H6SRK8_PARPM|nr:thiamine-phosphate kinase [Pararhodospirillum photometricum]CCG07537.1 Thiamine-monophosphate kinase [Pararhodospirillum photometricum DSM 122]
MTRRGEFALIRDLFAPLARVRPEALGLEDDAALLAVQGLGGLAVSADAIVAGVHFLPDDPPGSIAAKALRVNLSDMAAMGARPVGVLLTMALPAGLDDAWLESFARGLGEDLAAFEIALLGGDTVATPGPLTVSVTILGDVVPERALRRAGARVGDDLWVSGTLGDGTLGLRVARGGAMGLPWPLQEALRERYRRPVPRVALGQALVGVASAAMDISDGLCADAWHMARASGVGLRIEAPVLPVSEGAATLIADDPALFVEVLAGGDDYELLFTAPADQRDAVAAGAAACGTLVTRIGRVEAGEAAVVVVDAQGEPLALERTGWAHDA